MKYVSLDLETTSLEPHPMNILQLAAVLEDTDHADVPVEELPSFVSYARPMVGQNVTGQLVALSMNALHLRRIAGLEPSPYPVMSHHEFYSAFGAWLDVCGYPEPEEAGRGTCVAAGQNVGGFDLLFLPGPLRSRFSHRCIDAGSVFIDWRDERPVGLVANLKRHGVRHDLDHDALHDAQAVIKLLRTRYPAVRHDAPDLWPVHEGGSL